MPIKLPKQWEHWCADSKLRRMDSRYIKGRRGWLYLKGRGHVWRVNCHGQLERGDTIADFDRWALCDIDRTLLPRTRNGFRTSVAFLLALAGA